MRSPAPGDGALGIFLPQEVSQQVDRWRSVYLREHYERFPPHITIVYVEKARMLPIACGRSFGTALGWGFGGTILKWLFPLKNPAACCRVLHSPFVRVEEWPSMRPAIVECLAQFQPFDVMLKELGTFAGTPHVLWLKPDDDGHLARIHAQLAKRFSKYIPATPLDFVPHVTVGFFDTQAALSQAREAMLAEIAPLHFRIDALSYVVFCADDTWPVHDRLPLGKHPAQT